MAKRTPTARGKKTTTALQSPASQEAAPAGERTTKLHDNEQTAHSVASESQATFEFRFWDLGELKGQKQGVEVGHDGAPVDLFVFDEANFEAFKNGQQHQYIGGFGITAARHLFQIPFDGKWFLAVRPVKEGDAYEVAYRLMNFN